ncbi:MAG TPA: UPF0179 family protein [Thermoplasmata archaeon]|jgi:uncharacterized protein (UPF0179 family)
MVLVTVVGKLQCKKGFEFVFGGPMADCRDCKVKNICFHLESGRAYRVTEIRDVQHECKIHEEGVRVVEVERLPTNCTVPARFAVEGAMVTFEEHDCDFAGCPHYRLCRPWSASEGMRFRVVSVGEEVDCAKGKKLKVAILD